MGSARRGCECKALARGKSAPEDSGAGSPSRQTAGAKRRQRQRPLSFLGFASGVPVPAPGFHARPRFPSGPPPARRAPATRLPGSPPASRARPSPRADRIALLRLRSRLPRSLRPGLPHRAPLRARIRSASGGRRFRRTRRAGVLLLLLRLVPLLLLLLPLVPVLQEGIDESGVLLFRHVLEALQDPVRRSARRVLPLKAALTTSGE